MNAQTAQLQTDDSRRRLAQALCLSKDMLSAAQTGDWLEVECLDEARQLLLTDELFEAGSDESPLVTDAIAALIQVNQEITALAVEVKNLMSVQHRSLLTHQHAKSDYEAIAAAV